MPERETVQPDGGALEWSDEDIARLVGITPEGRISPAVLADAKADARRHADLNAFLNAQPTTAGDDGPPA